MCEISFIYKANLIRFFKYSQLNVRACCYLLKFTNMSSPNSKPCIKIKRKVNEKPHPPTIKINSSDTLLAFVLEYESHHIPCDIVFPSFRTRIRLSSQSRVTKISKLEHFIKYY